MLKSTIVLFALIGLFITIKFIGIILGIVLTIFFLYVMLRSKQVLQLLINRVREKL